MKNRDRSGANLAALGGKILARKKEKENAARNRRRLDSAALASRELGVQRIADEEIKKLVIRLAYEADLYIAAARESEDAFYDVLVLDALDTASLAVNVWKKNENEAAALKCVGINGMAADIVIPGENTSGDRDFRHNDEDGQCREKTVGILRESLRQFIIQNTIRTSGDPESALTELTGKDI